MKRLLSAVGLAALVLTLASPSPAGADDVAISAQVVASRAITAALFTTPIPDVSTGSADGVLAVTVTETSVTGDADWSVQAELCEDATCAQSQLVHSNGTNTIPNTALSLLNRATVYTPVLPLADADKTQHPGGEENLSAARTLFQVVGQDTNEVYTATYAHTSTVRLTPPQGTLAGTYTGVLRVTLVE